MSVLIFVSLPVKCQNKVTHCVLPAFSDLHWAYRTCWRFTIFVLISFLTALAHKHSTVHTECLSVFTCCSIRFGLCGGEVGVRCGGKLNLPGVCSSVAAGWAQVDGAAHREPAADCQSDAGQQRGESHRFSQETSVGANVSFLVSFSHKRDWNIFWIPS